MKKTTFLILILLVSFLISGQIINRNNPKNGTWEFKKKLLWETENAGKDVFGEIQNIAVSKEGSVFVADMKNSLIFMFDKNGKFVKSFGKKGEGPGEIREYFGGKQLHFVDTNILFADRAYIHYFDSNGNYKKTISYPPELRPREFVNRDTFISAPATLDPGSEKEAKVVLYNMLSKKNTVIASFKPFEKATDTQSNKGNEVTVGIVIGDITPLMQVTYSHGKVYYGMSNKNEINICNLSGKYLFKFSNPDKKPNPVSDEYKKELKKSFGDVPANLLNNIIKGLPENASFFSDIQVSKNGNIFLFESDPDSRSSKVIDIYNKEGNFIYRTFLTVDDDRTINNILIKEDTLYLGTEDDDGSVYLSKYSIRLPH